MRTAIDQPLIQHMAIILSFQLVGEVLVRSVGLLIPGPVVGMTLFLILLILRPAYAQKIRATATGILSHLSLLFVPAAVGVMGPIRALGTDAFLLGLVIAISTALTILVTAYTFRLTARLLGVADD